MTADWKIFWAAGIAALLFGIAARPVGADEIRLSAKDTLTVLEMGHGDQLEFRLRNGRSVLLVLEDTEATIVEEVVPGGIVYRFSANIEIDGQPTTLERFVCSQECFYEPFVVNGLRIWLDTVKDVFQLIPVRYPREGNLRCRPRKAVRLAIQDAALRICPEEVNLWIEHERCTLDVGECYNGDDCYLGPYLGQACHVGMDVNHPKGSVLFAPIGFDTQAYFNSLTMGHDNNRWRGIRRWANGDVWALQTHHLIKLLVPENKPIDSGTRYATTAGVRVGSHEHTHFEFKIGRPGQGPDPGGSDPASIAVPIDFDDESPLAQQQLEVLHLDPWIVFWQAFEDRKIRRGEIRAVIQPFGPVQPGQTATFFAEASQPEQEGTNVRYFWTFGDGGAAYGPVATHVFARPGVYSVGLTVDAGVTRDSLVQAITVSGEPVKEPVLVLAAPDEPSFRAWPALAAQVYGQPPQVAPHTLQFHVRPSSPKPGAKIVRLENRGGGQLGDPTGETIEYEQAKDWLSLNRKRRGDEQHLEVSIDASGLAPGKYGALVQFSSTRARNGPQWFRVELQVAADSPASEVTVDDRDPGFYATPYFWVGHRFYRCPVKKRGFGGFYLTNGGRAVVGEFARFTPNLRAGRYEVCLSDQTPFSNGVAFDVRVRHAQGESLVRVRPAESRSMGTFDFKEGTDGFVEILAEGSQGLVIADAIVFRKLQSVALEG